MAECKKSYLSPKSRSIVFKYKSIVCTSPEDGGIETPEDVDLDDLS